MWQFFIGDVGGCKPVNKFTRPKLGSAGGAAYLCEKDTTTFAGISSNIKIEKKLCQPNPNALFIIMPPAAGPRIASGGRTS
jgi:hypothetical protein